MRRNQQKKLKRATSEVGGKSEESVIFKVKGESGKCFKEERSFEPNTLDRSGGMRTENCILHFCIDMVIE